MNTLKNATIASASNSSIDRLLQEHLQSPQKHSQTAQTPEGSQQQETDIFHMMIRQALVDFGDHIVDVLQKEFEGEPKMVHAIENVRTTYIDPMRL